MGQARLHEALREAFLPMMGSTFGQTPKVTHKTENQAFAAASKAISWMAVVSPSGKAVKDAMDPEFWQTEPLCTPQDAMNLQGSCPLGVQKKARRGWGWVSAHLSFGGIYADV